jgi:hypothetical protein
MTMPQNIPTEGNAPVADYRVGTQFRLLRTLLIISIVTSLAALGASVAGGFGLNYIFFRRKFFCRPRCF